MTRTTILTCLLLAAAAPNLLANDPHEVLLRSSDPVPGVPGVTAGNLAWPAVNDAGSWSVRARDLSFVNREFVDGAVVMSSGDPIGAHVFASSDRRRALDPSGRLLWRVSVQANPNQRGLFSLDAELLFQDDPVQIPGYGGSTYTFTGTGVPFWVQGPGGNDSVVLFPTTAPSFQVDVVPQVVYDTAGNKLSEELFLEFPFTLPGTSLVAQPLLFNSLADVSGAGSYAVTTRVVDGKGVSRTSVVVNGQMVARQLETSPFGLPWSTVGLNGVSVNDAGSYALSGFVGELSNNTYSLSVNGEASFQAGTTLPAIHPYRLENELTALQIHGLGNGEQLLWTAEWDDPDPARGRGLMLDGRLIVAEGQSVIDGSLVVTIEDDPAMSQSGDWVVFTALLANGEDVLVRYATADLPVNYCTGGTASNGCVARITGFGVPSASGVDGFELRTSGIADGINGLFFFGANGRQANPWGNGTSLQCVVPPVQRMPVQTTFGGGPGADLCAGGFSADLNAHWNVAKPAQNPGGGAVVQAQVWYRDAASTSNQTTGLSDALEFTVCP